jgi:ketosteroid isomerase-like protein
VIEEATSLLRAFASSDVQTLDTLCSDDVLVWGTDQGEVWEGKKQVVSEFAGAFDLEVRWLGSPRVGRDWVAGEIQFALPEGRHMPARVTMVFREGLLTHAH